jgi:glutathione peroxidase-family protein
VRRRFAASEVRFMHVEVFKDNRPALGYNRWMRQWGLQSEPWTFLVGRDGRIEAKFEGSVSAAELEAAIRRLLL